VKRRGEGDRIAIEFPKRRDDVLGMSRKRKARGLPAWIPILLIVLVAGGAFVFFTGSGGSGSLRTVEELDPSLFYNNANSLRGNTYRIDAEIDSSLGNSPTKGRLFSVTLKGNAKGGVPVIMPVLVPPALGTLTVQKGQHYLMKVKVGDNGLLLVEEARKP
jgi:hypothetical protein